MSCDSAGARHAGGQSFPQLYVETDVQCPIVSMIVGRKADKEPIAQFNPKHMKPATYILTRGQQRTRSTAKKNLPSSPKRQR